MRDMLVDLNDSSKTIAPEENRIYIAIGQNVWAKGFTREQAIDTLTHKGYARRAKRLLYAVTDAWAYIDEMGDLVHSEDSRYVLVERTGKK